MRLTGDLDVAALELALGDLMARHESLRTVFPETLGVPHQQVLTLDAARPRLRVERIQANDLAEALRSAAAQGFDLAQEPPLRAHLFALGSDAQGERTHVLLLLLHHIAGDGSSLGPLARDLGRAYAARRAGTVPADGHALAPLPVQYADYTLWQHDVLGAETRSRQPHRTAAGVLDRDPRRPAGGDRAAGRPAAAGDRQLPRRPGAAAARRRSARVACWRWRGPTARACSWCCRPDWRRC